MIELNPDRHDELAALIANHMEEGGETLEAARWSARAAHWAGQQPAQRRAAPLARGDGAGRRARRERGGRRARRLLAPAAARLRLAAGHGAATRRRGSRRRRRRSRRGPATCARWPCCGCCASARPGLEQATADWIAGADEANRLADESGDLHLRVAIRAAGAYAHLCAADFDAFDRAADEVLELAGDDHEAGAGIIIGSPVAWALMGEGDGPPRARRVRGVREAAGEVAADRRGAGRPRDGELDPRHAGDAARDAGRPRGGRRARPAQLRADRAPRRRLLAQPGPRRTSAPRSSRRRTTRGRWSPSKRPSASTAKRSAAATSRRPGGGGARRSADRSRPGRGGGRARRLGD